MREREIYKETRTERNRETERNKQGATERQRRYAVTQLQSRYVAVVTRRQDVRTRGRSFSAAH